MWEGEKGVDEKPFGCQTKARRLDVTLNCRGYYFVVALQPGWSFVGVLDGRFTRMVLGTSDHILASWCKPKGAKHDSGSVLQSCLQLAETHRAFLLTRLLLTFLATLQAPEDTSDTRGGLTSICMSRSIGS